MMESADNHHFIKGFRTVNPIASDYYPIISQIAVLIQLLIQNTLVTSFRWK